MINQGGRACEFCPLIKKRTMNVTRLKDIEVGNKCEYKGEVFTVLRRRNGWAVLEDFFNYQIILPISVVVTPITTKENEQERDD